MGWIDLSSAERFRRLREHAEIWRDPEHEPRERAADQELERGTRITEEEVAFAINQAMDRLSKQPEIPEAPQVGRFGITSSGMHPMACFDLLCYAVSHEVPVFADLEASAPPIVTAWLDEAAQDVSSLVSFEPIQEWPDVDTHLVYDGTIPDAAVQPDADVVHLGASFGIGIIDGNESEDEREGLAEDALLFAEHSSRTIKLIWAPAHVEPDPFFEAFADLRGVFPAHESLAGSLEMNRAFLEARDDPHAYAEDLSFLISKGEPYVQRGGHVRWVTYEQLDEVEGWLHQAEKEVGWIACRSGLADKWRGRVPALNMGEFGQAHRPEFLALDGGSRVIEALR